MEDVTCSGCGEMPWLIQADGEYILRCGCNDCLAIDTAENTRYLPSSWTA